MLAGSATHNSGVFTIDAAGSDIWGASDQFHFVYQAVSGDVDIRARVDDLTAAHTWSKAGVMIRSALTADAAHGFALVSAGKGIGFQRRVSAGASSRHTGGELAAPPRWVRLVRQGTRLSAYSSANGTTWTVIGSDTIALGASAYVGLAVTSHNASTRTTSHVANTTVTKVGLPSGQSNADIGGPAVAGSASFADGTYTIRAAGTDIWSSADQFHYVYQAMSGDGEAVVRVRSLVNTDPWAKAGIMIRETLASGSRHALALVSAGNGYAFQRRAEPGSFSDHTSGGSGVAPGWLRLVREGSTFTAYRSADGVTWTVMGSDTINMAGSTVYVGIAVTSHNTATATTAVADSFRVSAGTAPPANEPPTVALTAPANGTQYTAPATITLAATASDPEGRLSAVEFYNGSTLLSRDAASPYSFAWGSVAAGTYTLTAVATDADGGRRTSSAVTVSVSAPANQPPTVSLTAPASGSQYTAPATITLTASASDPEGRLSGVDFYSGTTLLGRDTASPYSFAWSGVAAGTYALTAVARDADGASAASAAVSVAVNAATVSPPRLVTFTASVDHATAVTSYLFEVFANGANPDTAMPVATSDLGKPTPDAAGEITVDRATFFSNLAAGTYVATVSAIGPGGRSRSAPVTFTR